MAKEFTRADVKSHNDNRSSWIIIHNNIYDVTAFLNEHPGGEEVLLEQAGSDASEAFEDVGHSSDARELMLKYKVGEVVEAERKPIKEKTATWATPTDETSSAQSSLKSLILPVLLGIVATVIYRYYIYSQ